MLLIFKKIYRLLVAKERWQLLWLSLAMVLMAIIEAAGVASILPFMAVVGNPEVVESNKWMNWAYRAGGFSSTDRFLVFLGFMVLVVIIVSNLIKAATTWIEMRFTNYLGCNLSIRVLLGYLQQPYDYFLNRNTSLMEMILLQEVKGFTHLLLQPLVHMFASLVVIFSMFSLLIFFEPMLSFLMIFTLGGSYLIIYLLVKKTTQNYGDVRFEANIKRCKVVSEALGGIKELRVLGRERVFYDEFSLYATKMAKGTVFHQTVSQMPRYFMEILSFGGILLILLYFLMLKRDLGEVLPFLALYALAGYRIMPQMQGIFSSLTSVRFHLPALESLYSAQQETKIYFQPNHAILPLVSSALRFSRKIEISKMSFSYPGSTEPVLSKFNLIIDKNSRVGFVGPSGSGKTTTVDIFLGLLAPQEGEILIDDVPVTLENMRGWQNNLGYVPQTIFLCDDTLANNIAFGVSPADVDMLSVERAAKLANLHDFVVNDLPQGYATVIGESGVRLSGGQRQRIGIARALYHDPEVLVMDEATSALDGITEEAVIQAIQGLAGKKTILTIAHRLTTLRGCDVIYVMDKGRIVEQGTYDELSKGSARFQAMGRAGLTPEK